MEINIIPRDLTAIPHIARFTSITGHVTDFDISYDIAEGDLILTPANCSHMFEIHVHRLDITYEDDPNYTYENGSEERYLPFDEDYIECHHVQSTIMHAMNRELTNWDMDRVTFVIN